MARRRLQAAVALGKEIDLSNWAAMRENDEDSSYTKLCDVKQFSLPAAGKWGIFSMQYSHDGRNLALGLGNGGVISLNMETSQFQEFTRGYNREGLGTMALYHHPFKESILVSAGASGKIEFWDTRKSESKSPLEIIQEDNEISALDFNLDGFVFGTVGKDKNIRLYDGKSNILLKVIQGPDYLTTDETTISSGHTKRIFAIKFHPEDNNVFVTAGWDDCLKIWDKRMAKNCKKFITGPHICGAALDILSNQILTGSWRAKDAIQLWDLRWETSYIKGVPYPHDRKQEGEFIYCAQFVSKDVLFAGGSGTNNACAISAETDQVLGIVQASKPVMALDILQKRGLFAVGGIGGFLHVGSFS